MPDAGWTVNVLMDTEFGACARRDDRDGRGAADALPCRPALAHPHAAPRAARTSACSCRPRRTTSSSAASPSAPPILPASTAASRRRSPSGGSTEQQLRQTQADLIQAGKLAGLGQMSAALSHELNQPLAAAKTYADNAAC